MGALQSLCICILSWIVLHLFQRFALKTAVDNLPGPLSNSFVLGNFKEINNVDGWDFHKKVSEKYGGIIKLKALFGANLLYVFDPKALHHIVVKDQHIFEEPDYFILGNRLMYGEGLLSTIGDRHRKQRKMLNPVFSIAHMRNIIPIFWRVTNKLQNAIRIKIQKGDQGVDIDMLQWMTRTALELIGQGGFGYSFDPLVEEDNPHPYSLAAKEFVPVLSRLIFHRKYFLKVALQIGSPRFRRLLLDIIPWKTGHKLRDIVDVLHKTSVEVVESSKSAMTEGGEEVREQFGQGKDIMSVLLRENMKVSAEERLSDAEITAQISTFTIAATDTTSAALSSTLYQLASHPEVQEVLRNEILEAFKGRGDLSYDQLSLLPYLDAVCRETLRLYPPLSMAVRTTCEDVILPFSTPVKGIDGHEIHEVFLPKDSDVIVSIISANRNPEIWGPDSYKWKPERWLSPLPDSVPNARIPGIYSHLMSFFGGSRACIGFKFSQLEMKVVLASLLSAFKFQNSNEEVIWQMNRISTPVVRRDGVFHPELPMKVSLVTSSV